MRWSAVLLLTLIACGDNLSSTELAVTFDQTPSPSSNQGRGTFAFHTEGAVSRLTCTLDDGESLDCQSPFTVTVAGEGAHTFTVSATGEALQIAHATFAWSVDLTAPDTEITLSPPAIDAEPSATLMFIGHHTDVAHFECSLDRAAFARCASPFPIAVSDGLHTFRVRAVDAAGNADQTPAQVSWSVDTSAPLASFTAGPIGPVASRQPTFAFVAPPGEATLECQLDGGAFTACTSPVTTAELSQGAHFFSVRATNLAGTSGTVSRAFLVDTLGPAITIVSGPASPSDATPTWTFAVTGGAATVQCHVDAAALVDCADGTFTAPVIADGEHTFEIQARDALGNLGTQSSAFSIDTATCGDGAIDPTLEEVCDGANLGGATCETVGDFDGGTLGCSATCAAFDTSGCRKCGNGAIEAPETCDGANLGGATCATYGFTAGSLACSASCGLDPSGCGVCGDGAAQAPEVCDGGDLRGATCASLGQGTGALACNAGCGGYDPSGCSGGEGYAPANAGFTGTPCFDGLRFSTPQYGAPYVLACTEEHGVYKTALSSALAWMAGGLTGATNLRGRVVATNPAGPPVYYIADASAVNNAFRSSTAGDTWTAQSINDAGVARELFSFVFRPQVGNLAGSWDAALGATVLHGNAPNLVPHFVGPTAGSVTGTVRGIASGGAKDVYVAVYGKTPSGEPASGGIFRACDLSSTGGGSYEARHSGIAAADQDRVWSLTVDPSSIVTTAFQCGASTVSGSANVYYAALRGGGQIYKTTDGGVSWARSNTGLPAGLEINVIAVHCFAGAVGGATCHDPSRLYAATSDGLYVSTDAGAHWELDAFAGKSVRAVAIDPSSSTPRVLVGVDDAVGIYQSL